MKIIPTDIVGIYLIDIEPIGDERGFFARAWCSSVLSQHGLKGTFLQTNISSCARAGTIRGLHYQMPPHAEAKLVRCIRGAVFDVAVDARPASSTFGEWFGAELTQDNRRSMYIPEGFAHGYQALEDEAEVLYSVTAPYHAPSENGVRFDDPAIGIGWPLKAMGVSSKDRSWPLLSVANPDARSSGH